MEIIQSEQQNKRGMEKENKIENLWDNIKCVNLYIIEGLPWCLRW